LTARARIVDAAIDIFAAQGMAASMRAIASRAGVSPALITHHFGSKQALKAECDERMLAAYAGLKMAGVADLAGSLRLLGTGDPALERLIGYILRAILDGGEPARRFFERFVARTQQVMDAASAAGQVRAECARPAQVRYLTASSLGAALIELLAGGGQVIDVADHPDQIDAQLDVLTNGAFTDDTVLRAFRSHFHPPNPTQKDNHG
jgi:AcrR family transcriptional regulator